MGQHSYATAPVRAARYGRTAVIGGGAWGTALAALLARGGDVCLWARDAGTVAAINAQRENPRYLPGIALPECLRADTDMARALTGAEAALIVVPSGAVRATAAAMAPHLPQGIPVAIAAKGIEAGTGTLMAQIGAEALPDHPIGVVSGPTFAAEVARGQPSAATVAFSFSAADRANPADSPAARLAVSLRTETFRPYVTDDVVGVEVGGAVKNVIAIACGMAKGAGHGDNARAALITRGLAEMTLLAEALGGRAETLAGLSGLGDLTLTCSSLASRNMSLGLQLGEGRPRADCFDGAPVVVEGEANAASVTDLARARGVDLPICETVRAILHEGTPMRAAFARLLARPLKAEPRVLDLALDHPDAP